MRKVNMDSHYLKNQSRKYLSRAVLFLLLFILLFSLTGYLVLFKTENISTLEGAGFVTSLIMLILFRHYQQKYRIYESGRQGEKTVNNALTKNLGDEYCLINGAYLKGGGGDVDHILLGPSGVYVLETKNWSGKIVCHGDQWQRPGKKNKTNPSLQVKHNTQKIRHIINTIPTLQNCHVWVEGIIVFTNPHADLSINNPTVTILRLSQLIGHIKNQKNNHLTKEQVQQITKQIQNT